MPACAQTPVPAASAYTTTPAIAVELRGENLYLVGRSFRSAADTIPVHTGKGLIIDCTIPSPAVRLSFLFVDGSHYEYIPQLVFPGTSFAVLLRGEVKLPKGRRGPGGVFARSKWLHGDEALLQRLQTRELQSVRCEEEKITYWDGKKLKEYGPARTYMNPTEFEAMRNELKRLAP